MKIPNLKERLTTRFKCVVPKPSFLAVRQVKTPIVDDDTQIIGESVEFKTFDRRTEMKPYRCSDFSLHNLLSVGVQLDDVKLQSSQLATADNLVATLASMPDLPVTDDDDNNN